MGDTVEGTELDNLPRNAVVFKALPRLHVGSYITCHAEDATVEKPEKQRQRFLKRGVTKSLANFGRPIMATEATLEPDLS